MGYSYGPGGLCCDSCGMSGGVRKRKCVHKVTDDRDWSMPYCYPPALCPSCYKAAGGARGVHGEECRQGAAASQARYDASRVRLDAGHRKIGTAWGSWHELVPEGWVGVRAVDRDGAESFYLVPKDEYDNGGFVEDFPRRVAWVGPDARTKEVVA